MAVVDQNTTLLQEIPLFPSQEPINNIVLHQVEHWHATVPSYRHNSVMHTRLLRVSRVALWWAAPCLWLRSRLKAAVFIPAARCVPEPEVWAVCGARKKKSAQKQQQSECNNETARVRQLDEQEPRKDICSFLEAFMSSV